ncbi:hypothetical protein BH10BAC1_BH10BAC1_20050 [soil metagenome]
MNYTYYNGRECRFCQTEIADQIHASRKYCPREVLEDGSIKSCKDDYNSPIRKEKNAHFKGFLVHHEMMRNNIRELYQNVGELVTKSQINQHGIVLNRPAEFGWNKEEQFIYYFVGYALIRLNENNFKIIKHDKVF